MKNFYKTFLPVIAVCVMLVSCSKKSDTTKPKGNITAVATNWTVTVWGGVQNNPLSFSINNSTAIGTVTAVGSQPFGFSVGDQIFKGVTANGDGTYSAQGEYTPDGTTHAYRNCTMSLQNNNTQLTVYYPALSSSFPAITYIFQQSSTLIELP